MATKIAQSYYVTVKTQAANGKDCWIEVEKFDNLAKARKAMNDPKFAEKHELVGLTLDVTIKREEPGVYVVTSGRMCPHCNKMISGEVSIVAEDSKEAKEAKEEAGKTKKVQEKAQEEQKAVEATDEVEPVATEGDQLTPEEEQEVQNMLDQEAAAETGETPPPPPPNPAFPAG